MTTPKLSPALSISSTFWRFWGEIIEITRHARVIWFPRLGGLPHSAVFRWRKLTPLKRVTRTGWPGNPPWWGTPPNRWTRSRKKKKRKKRSYGQIGYPTRAGDLTCLRSSTSMWKGPWVSFETWAKQWANYHFGAPRERCTVGFFTVWLQ